jgi:hypothetical protein
LKKLQKDVTKNFIKQSLINNKNYTKVLEIIGLSPKPISAYQLHQKFIKLYKNIEYKETIDKKKGKTKSNKKHNQYIYKMIKNLRPDIVENFYTFFFNWDES